MTYDDTDRRILARQEETQRQSRCVIIVEHSVTPDRRLFASSWLMLASRGGAQIIYSAAAGR
jgi:hypothetical protein